MSPLDKLFTVRIKAAPGVTNTSERLHKDLEQIRRVAAGFEKDEGDSRGSAVIEEKYAKRVEEIEAAAESRGGGDEGETEVEEELRIEAEKAVKLEALVRLLFGLLVAGGEADSPHDGSTDQEDARFVPPLPSLRLPHVLLLPSDLPLCRGARAQVSHAPASGIQDRHCQRQGLWWVFLARGRACTSGC